MLFQPNAIVEGKYRVRRFLGQGGSAEVYLVTHLALSTDRAIKVISKEIDGVGSSTFGDYRRRFAQEAKLGAGLDHPNLIRVHDFIERPELAVLEMEYAPGGSLAELITTAKSRSEPVALARCLAIAKDVAEGLARLHEADIVHRDLKPANILLDAAGRAKVSDLGLAQTPWGDSARSVYGPEDAKRHPGTPAYMSPEQERETSHLRPSADVYAWAATLFELLTLRQLRNVPPGTHAATLRADVPLWLDDLLARCLANAPEQRPWDGTALTGVLEAGDAGAAQSEAEPSGQMMREDVARREREDKDTPKGALAPGGDKGQTPKPSDPSGTAGSCLAVGLAIVLLAACGVFGLARLLEGRNASDPGGPGMTASVEADPPTTTHASSTVPTALPTKARGSTPAAPTVTPTETSGPFPTAPTAIPTQAIVTEDPISKGKGLLPNGLPDIAWVDVPAGPFIMGADDHRDDEKPRRTVDLPAFRISKYETTNAQYQAFVAASDGYRDERWWNEPVTLAARAAQAGSPQWSEDNLPASGVSWYDAVAYTRWLTARLRAARDLEDSIEIRLPTEEEWEKAARGTDGREYPWGNGYQTGYANIDEKGPTPVGAYPQDASPFGALDMAGNLLEWTLTDYETRRSENLATDRPRVARGGAWSGYPDRARVSYRYDYFPVHRGPHHGFRVVLVAPVQ